MIKTELAQEAEMPNSARKGPVRTCKNAGICQHGLARSSAISRQHTTMCVDIGTQYPHKHHATFTLFYSTLIPKSKMTINMPHHMAIFSRHLTPRLARWVKQKWLYVCHLCNRCFSHLCYKLFLCRIHFLL